MFPYSSDYYWDQGIPYPLDHVKVEESPEAFRVVHDPYRKRIILERYKEGRFHDVGYDSALLDFRHLSEQAKAVWHKEELGSAGLVRDEHDCPLLLEHYRFDGERCLSTELHSPQGLLLGRQVLYFQDRGDEFDGVVLYDSWNRPVLLKRYSLSSDGSFATLLEERWQIKGWSDGRGANRKMEEGGTR